MRYSTERLYLLIGVRRINLRKRKDCDDTVGDDGPPAGECLLILGRAYLLFIVVVSFFRVAGAGRAHSPRRLAYLLSLFFYYGSLYGRRRPRYSRRVVLVIRVDYTKIHCTDKE